jgi:hypothetical protein
LFITDGVARLVHVLPRYIPLPPLGVLPRYILLPPLGVLPWFIPLPPLGVLPRYIPLPLLGLLPLYMLLLQRLQVLALGWTTLGPRRLQFIGKTNLPGKVRA